MEESCEVQSDENRSLPEKKPKRMVKTPSQVEALENFYDEHKYPTESMKLELAESIGLTEKQVSGWFCHRRLKDKKLLNGDAYAHGRQDRSSGVIQDHGSGLKQDSCGSTKQGDYRHYDAREVESRRLAGEDLSAADLRYELGSHQTGNNSSTDDTSSGSRSPLEDSRPPQNTVPFSMASSRYLPQIAKSVSIDMNSLKGRTGPAGYLKVKGMVENSAITSVKRQLGRHYREDGPPLCVEFEPLPPGAFESPIKDPVDGSYYAGEPFPFQSDGHPYKQPDPGPVFPVMPSQRYKGYNTKINNYNSRLDETSSKMMHGSKHFENYLQQQFNQKPSSNQRNHFLGSNSSMEMPEDAGETSVYDLMDNNETKAKHGYARTMMDSVSSHHLHRYGGEVTNKQREPRVRNYDDMNPKVAQRERIQSTPMMLKHDEFLDMKEKGQPRRMSKEGDLNGERRKISMHSDLVPVKTRPTNEMRAAKRVRDEYRQQQHLRKAATTKLPPLTNKTRCAAEVHSSFSEDETAVTRSS